MSAVYFIYLSRTYNTRLQYLLWFLYSLYKGLVIMDDKKAQQKELVKVIYHKYMLVVPLINLAPIDENLKRIQNYADKIKQYDETVYKQITGVCNATREIMCQLLENLITEAESQKISKNRKDFKKISSNIKNHLMAIQKYVDNPPDPWSKVTVETSKVTAPLSIISSLSQRAAEHAESLGSSFKEIKDMKKGIIGMVTKGRPLSAFVLKKEHFEPQ